MRTPPCPSLARPAPRFSAPITAAERREFIPFMHTLIGTAFAVIQPLFLSAVAVSTKADATPVTAADRGANFTLQGL